MLYTVQRNHWGIKKHYLDVLLQQNPNITNLRNPSQVIKHKGSESKCENRGVEIKLLPVEGIKD